jgi:hypothetical protein
LSFRIHEITIDTVRAVRGRGTDGTVLNGLFAEQTQTCLVEVTFLADSALLLA